MVVIEVSYFERGKSIKELYRAKSGADAARLLASKQWTMTAEGTWEKGPYRAIMLDLRDTEALP